MRRLKEMRIAAGYSCKELAAAVGVSEPAIRKWEDGTNSHIRYLKIAIRLSEVLCCPLSEIVSNAGSLISQQRLKLGIGKDEVAKALSVSVKSVCDWERGKFRPSENNIVKLAGLFGCSPEMLGFSIKCRPPVEDRNKVVMEHEYIIRSVLSRNGTLIRASRAEYEDLYQSLALRLVRAVDTYDPQRGTFETHVFKALQYELRTQAALSSAHGIKDAPRDFFPAFCSFEGFYNNTQINKEA